MNDPTQDQDLTENDESVNMPETAEDSSSVETDSEDGDQDSGPDDMLGELLSEPEDVSAETESSEGSPDDQPGETPSGDEATTATGVSPKETPAERALREEITQLREERMALLKLLGQQAPPKQPVPEKKSDTDDLPLNVIRLALGGATKEEWERIPASQKEKVQRFLAEHNEREARYVADPALRYKEVYRQKVLEDVFEVLNPVLKDYHERRAQGAVERHLTPLKDPKLQSRAREIYAQLPGARSASWDDQEQALRAAAGLAKLERLEQQQANVRQGKAAQNVQRQATGGKGLKATPKTGGSQASKALPEMKEHESLMDYYERIKPHVK